MVTHAGHGSAGRWIARRGHPSVPPCIPVQSPCTPHRAHGAQEGLRPEPGGPPKPTPWCPSAAAQAVEPARRGSARPLHTTAIRNEAAYFGCVAQLLAANPPPALGDAAAGGGLRAPAVPVRRLPLPVGWAAAHWTPPPPPPPPPPRLPCSCVLCHQLHGAPRHRAGP